MVEFQQTDLFKMIWIHQKSKRQDVFVFYSEQM